ncbi:MAG: sigma-70 family RNA polymerase sigma factor [Longimicrobiales bacterium]
MSESPDLKDIPPLSDLTDEELVDAHRKERPGAFRELYGRYQGRLSHFIRKRTGASERVQDLLQETWVRVARHLHRFDTDRRFSTWVYTITANLCKNELRNRSRSRMVSMGTLEARRDTERGPIQFEDLSFLPDRLYEKRETRALVEQTVRALPQHHREVFQLREIKGRSYQNVADTLGIRLGTVKSRLHRARTEFAQRIAPLVDAELPAFRESQPRE